MSTTPNTVTVNVTESNTETNHKPLRPHVVIMHDSEHHSDVYVFKVCSEVFKMSAQDIVEVVTLLCTEGKACVFSGHKELCELKAEQATSFGRDMTAIEMGYESVGPMTITVEPQ